jgi:hypothetical protein
MIFFFFFGSKFSGRGFGQDFGPKKILGVKVGRSYARIFFVKALLGKKLKKLKKLNFCNTQNLSPKHTLGY